VTAASVRQLAGIQKITGDLEKGTLVVEYDPRLTTPEQMAQQIEKVGYRVEGRFTIHEIGRKHATCDHRDGAQFDALHLACHSPRVRIHEPRSPRVIDAIPSADTHVQFPDAGVGGARSTGSIVPPRRQRNGYREYTDADVARVRFIAGARQLGFSLDDNIEILELRDHRQAPCRVVLNMIEQKSNEIQNRIAELKRLDQELRQLYAQGLKFPLNDVDGKKCVCHLVSEKANSAARLPKRSRRKSRRR